MVAKVKRAELELDVQAYYDAAGNKAEAARARGLKRKTYFYRLDIAQRVLGVTLNKVADGRVGQVKARQLDLPPKGHIKRYVLTSLQNNTHLHPGFNNILALVDWLDGHDGNSCELMVGTFSYQKSSYGSKSVKRGTLKGDESDKEWYAQEAVQYLADEMVQLAPALVWNGHMNILPTNKHPLSDFETYNGRMSNIVPHAQIAMESVASMPDEAAKLNFSTGTVGQLNYIQKRAGIIAEQRHSYGAVLVEVDHEGSWWVRQLHIDEDDAIYDIGPDGMIGGIQVQGGEVFEGEFIKAINWGDAHASEMDLWVRQLGWGDGGMIDQLHPKYQFMNDLFSMRSRSHWELKQFHRMYEKHLDGEETVEDEVQITADFMRDAHRDWCETVVVPSNHDKHLDRWLEESDFRLDLVNAKYFCWLQYNLLDAMDTGDKSFNPLEFALVEAGSPKATFLDIDESFVICRDTPLGGVECGLHGHQGNNGARGSTQGLTKLGRAINKGHDHTAAIRLNVYSAGACAITYPYMSGPHSHSITHTVTFDNGKRQQVTMWAGKFRA
ncbi:MAG: hypothetical protein V3S55_15380 [Nitrospiraceae bacterium]